MFYKFHVWYDAVQEPWRFFIFIIMIIFWITPMYAGIFLGVPLLTHIGTVGMVLITALAISRLFYQRKR